LINYLLLTIVLLWSIRLTYNWIRGWKGLNHEDWRYVQLRKNNPRSYPLVNFFGIHLFPTVIVFIALLPFYFAIQNPAALSILHVAGLLVSATGFLLQLIADEQLNAWRKINHANTCLKTGLWKFSRHPNYLGEIVFWWGGWLLVMGTNISFYWTAIGALLLTGMFIFISIPMIEKRHLEKRLCYQELVQQVPMLIGKNKRK
jgi:steroid 5-alpha reductase family enzyme